MMTQKSHDFTGKTGIMFLAGIGCALLAMSLLGADQVQDSPGPFQISTTDGPYVYVLDTRTGHTWQRSEGNWIDLGTPREPTSAGEVIDP